MIDGIIDYEVIRLDLEGRICSWHPGAERLTEHGAESASVQPPASRSGLRVLVADDLAANRCAVSFGLERMGHRVDAVSNGADAVNAITAGEYDLVLMDVQTPVVDGITATRTVRSLRPGGQPPIVATTARATAEIRQACLDAGMDSFLRKPIQTADLVRVINEVTQRRGIVPPADAAADQP
jgi:CheY-like chemotaxis protein